MFCWWHNALTSHTHDAFCKVYTISPMGCLRPTTFPIPSHVNRNNTIIYPHELPINNKNPPNDSGILSHLQRATNFFFVPALLFMATETDEVQSQCAQCKAEPRYPQDLRMTTHNSRSCTNHTLRFIYDVNDECPDKKRSYNDVHHWMPLIICVWDLVFAEQIKAHLSGWFSISRNTFELDLAIFGGLVDVTLGDNWIAGRH